MRRLTSGVILAVLAYAGGCAGLQIREQLAGARGTPVVTVDNVSFDGEYLNGRILIGTDDAGYVVVDRRLSAHAVLVVDGVFDCDGGSTVNSLAADAVINPPRPQDHLAIEPGYWYGSNFGLLVYDEGMSGAPVPACIQVLLAVNLEAAAPGADRPQIVVRASLARPDGGTGADPAHPDASAAPQDAGHL